MKRTVYHPMKEQRVVSGPMRGEANIQKVVVLDVNTQFAAMKIVSHPHELDFAGLHDCAYPGVEKTPGTTVSLGLYNLETSEIEEWQVYPSAWSPEDCVPHEKSKAVLEQAKATMKKAGLDITRKPAPVPLSKDGVTLHNKIFTQQSLRGATPDHPLFVEVFGADADDANMTAVTRTELRVDDQVRYQIQDTYETMMAGNLSIAATKAYDVGDGVVVLFEHQFTSGRGNGNSYSFSPGFR